MSLLTALGPSARVVVAAWALGAGSLAGAAHAGDPVPATHASEVLASRGPESASALAGRLGLRFEDGGGYLLLSDSVTRVRIFPNTHRISLDGEEHTLRGYFPRGPLGVSVPAPAAGIIERHVGEARARIRALNQPVAVQGPSAPVRVAPRANLPTPLALPKPLPKAPAPAAAPTASSVKGDAGWEVAAAPRAWKWIVLHHSDDTSGNLREVRPRPPGKGWEHGCGYHFVIGNGTPLGRRRGRGRPALDAPDARRARQDARQPLQRCGHRHRPRRRLRAGLGRPTHAPDTTRWSA